jgi:hypothetical protein
MSFKDFWSKFSQAFSILAPIAVAFIPGGQIPAVAAAVIPHLPGLMSIADGIVGATGPMKKDFVMQSAQILASTVSDLSTGGQKETWDKEIAPNLSVMIDTAVALTKVITPTLIDDSVSRSGL